ncbi:potassium channel subfamily T member 2 isoform X5 [Aphis craccivora]|uniref:Potassium channel subfamily T member 2 isoform X5 n=1 Tax=Aphis craccivora TaxID=307492 RepID=A0A6G0Z1V5_APHCR|nr:potassium channel subfamily T member 2 isoform X5 [Aphis craccivora]
MSMFFFRLHNLRREEEIKKRRKRGMRHRHQLTLAPSRLFEKPPLTPSDSLDAVALQIPRIHNDKDSMQMDGSVQKPN